MNIIFNELRQPQEILLGHSVFASREYGYHGYHHTASWISNKCIQLWDWSLFRLLGLQMFAC